MKGIETGDAPDAPDGSDHCPAMKGIETWLVVLTYIGSMCRSDHCPAMKGIETPNQS